MEENNNSNQHQDLNSPTVEGSIGTLSPLEQPTAKEITREYKTAEEKKVFNLAGNKARTLRPVIKQLKEEHKYIIFDKARFEQLVENSAYAEVIKEFPSTEHFDELVDIYHDTFTVQIGSILQSHGISDELADAKQRQLRAWAIEDRAKYQSLPDSESFVHNRAVLRSADVAGYASEEACEKIETLTDSIEQYKKYYRTAGQEVTWPGPDSF